MDVLIDERKLAGYCLNPRHPVGKHKARVFAAALGLDEGDAPLLKRMILDEIPSARWAKGERDEYGQRWQCEVTCFNDGKSAIICCAWIASPGTSVARLTTCYVKRS